MWKVLRRHQGLDAAGSGDASSAPGATFDVPICGIDGATEGYVVPTTAAQAARLSRFHINARALALHNSTPQAAPAPADSLTTPYGDWVYGKLMQHATHENPVLRKKAHWMLLELFAQKNEHAVASMNHNAMNVMINSLKDPEEDVRGLACMALQVIVHTARGQELLFEGAHFPALLAVLDDEAPHVVAEGLRLCTQCHMAINDGAATERLVQAGCVPKYVSKVGSPDDDVCCAALSALAKTVDVKEAFIAVNDHHALPAVTKCLRGRTDPAVLVVAAEVVSKLAFFSAGKRAAVNERTVEAILAHVSHDDAVVRTAATGALVALTISEAGKRQAIDAGAVDRLVLLLDGEGERDVLVNAVQTVCNLSEDPRARQQLAGLVPRLQAISEAAQGSDETLVSLRKAVDRAIALIRWRPGDVY